MTHKPGSWMVIGDTKPGGETKYLKRKIRFCEMEWTDNEEMSGES